MLSDIRIRAEQKMAYLTVLLEVVPLAGYVRHTFDAGAQPHHRALAVTGIRLLGMLNNGWKRNSS